MNRQDDHEDFENFLKRFQPRAPQPLRMEAYEPVVRRPFVYALGAVAAMIVGVSSIGVPHGQVAEPLKVLHDENGERLSNTQPLTLGRANEVLSRAPSVKTAIDEMTFKSGSKQITNGTHSALTVLGKQEIKL